MNIRSTTPVLKRFATTSTIVAAAVMITFSSVTAPVYADQYDEQIKKIQGQIDGYQSEAAKLSAQADNLKNAIGKLQAQQDAIQAQVNLSQAKYDQLVKQIKDTEVKIARNQDVLGETIGDLYVNNSVSPVEMLASSKNIGDYLDQQEFRSSVRDRVETATKEIKTLKKALEEKKVQVEQVLNDQKAQKAALAAKQAEQNKLLADTQGSEAAYNSLIGQQNQQISSLRSQQAAANAARLASAGGGGSVTAGDPSKGGYPSYLANAPQDSIVDPWGMYNRECVSYTAWKVHQTYGYMPYWGGRGNANQWPGAAASAGIPMGSTPKPGSVGVMTGGYYGHVAWVESVSGGSVHVSQYNWGLRGEYTEMTVPASFFDTYIYFGG